MRGPPRRTGLALWLPLAVYVGVTAGIPLLGGHAAHPRFTEYLLVVLAVTATLGALGAAASRLRLKP